MGLKIGIHIAKASKILTKKYEETIDLERRFTMRDSVMHLAFSMTCTSMRLPCKQLRNSEEQNLHHVFARTQEEPDTIRAHGGVWDYLSFFVALYYFSSLLQLYGI